MNPTETEWLKWARALISANQQRQCGVCNQDVLSAFGRVQWPGYIGENYRPGGMLFVGAVHNLEELETPPMVELATFAEQWAKHTPGFTDRAYLKRLRSAYIESATKRISKSGKAWTDGQIWKAFATLKTMANRSWADVAFTNWSKCASSTQADPQVRSRLYKKHISDCVPIMERLPILQLKPRAVFVLCGDASVVSEVRAAKLDVPIIRVFNQRGYASKFPDQRCWEEWKREDIGSFLRVSNSS